MPRWARDKRSTGLPPVAAVAGGGGPASVGRFPAPPRRDVADSPTRNALPGRVHTNFPCLVLHSYALAPLRVIGLMLQAPAALSVADPAADTAAEPVQQKADLADSKLTSLCRALPARGQHCGPPRGAVARPPASRLLDS